MNGTGGLPGWVGGLRRLGNVQVVCGHGGIRQEALFLELLVEGRV